MSTQEILEELPKLAPDELESVYRRVIELHQGHGLEASPLAGCDQGNETAQTQSSLAARWVGKFEMPEADSSDPRVSDLMERYQRHRS